jgi:hypothetical protein
MGGRVRAAFGIVVVAVLVGLGTTACTADRSEQLSIEAPTYVPTDLPGGFGEHPLRYEPDAHGYTLAARAHDTTYTVRVRNRLDGDAVVDPARVAGPQRRVTPRADGSMGWTDQVAAVSVTAVGPVGHTEIGLRTTALRLVVAPQRVLDELVAATRHDRGVEIELEPVEFPHASTTVEIGSYGRLGRAGFWITTGWTTNGSGTCSMGCDAPERLLGWREGKLLKTLVLAPRSTVVVPDDGIDVERRYVPFNGTDAILLTTERADEPSFAIGTPHHRLHRWTMREDSRDA